ncbi:MAG: hypothetical protein RIE73_30855 [Coleofasciculus sp. C1-SOL-03]|jgi:hypothetical protein|uniref:hypothetical protein n=1 Tax=Coleofasciculus sp. C1-SOL-03 TaxID=3069522 RepID=UPI0033026C19
MKKPIFLGFAIVLLALSVVDGNFVKRPEFIEYAIMAVIAAPDNKQDNDENPDHQQLKNK